jgi:hypothetical protein
MTHNLSRFLPVLLMAGLLVISACRVDDDRPTVATDDRAPALTAADVDEFRSDMNDRLQEVDSDINQLEQRATGGPTDDRDDWIRRVEDLRDDRRDIERRLNELRIDARPADTRADTRADTNGVVAGTQPNGAAQPRDERPAADGQAGRTDVSHSDLRSIRADVLDLERRVGRTDIEFSANAQELRTNTNRRLERIDRDIDRVPARADADDDWRQDIRDQRQEVEQRLAEADGADQDDFRNIRGDVAGSYDNLRSSVNDRILDYHDERHQQRRDDARAQTTDADDDTRDV